MRKVLDSAIANAENRFEDVDVDRAGGVSEAYVNEGPRMKRVRPAPMGRAYRVSEAHGAYRHQGGDKNERNAWHAGR